MPRRPIQSLLPALAAFAVALWAAAAPAAPRFMRIGEAASREAMPTDAPKDLTIDEHPGAALPLDLELKDDAGRTVSLRKYFDGQKPVVLQFGYFECPMLCGLVSRGLADSLKDIPLSAGKDFQVVYVSIDPTETPDLARRKKESYLQEYGRPGAADGWHLLTGGEAQVAALAKAAGFQYQWVPSAKQFAHPAVLMVGTPDGKLSRYLYGVSFDPKTVRLSLVEASGGKIGTTTDRFILTCLKYDGHQGRYAFAAIGLMRIAGAVTVLAVGFVLVRLFRREARGLAGPGRMNSPPTGE